MSTGTAIEWTEATWNTVTGCTKVSPGCDHCYIERTPPFRMAKRWFDEPGIGGTTGVQLHPDRLVLPLRWRKPRRIFVNSLADLFHEAVPNEHIARTFAVMALARRHTFQVLTKRHGRMCSLLTSGIFRKAVAEHATDILSSRPWQRWQLDLGGHRLAGDSGLGGDWTCTPTTAGNLWSPVWPLPNVWLGVSVEDQKRADLRIPILLDTPAVVRWLSCEPLLGPVNLWNHLYPDQCPAGCGCRRPDDADANECGCDGPCCTEEWNPRSGIDWVVVGGESGPGARPMHPDWARDLRDQCESGVPFFFKQWGEWAPIGPTYPQGDDFDAMTDAHMDAVHLEVVDKREVIELESDGSIPHGYQPGDPRTWLMARLGKRGAGRELDGQTWDQYPVVT